MFILIDEQGLFCIQNGLVSPFSFPVPFPNQKGKREEKPLFFLQKSPSFSILLYIFSSIFYLSFLFEEEKRKFPVLFPIPFLKRGKKKEKEMEKKEKEREE